MPQPRGRGPFNTFLSGPVGGTAAGVALSGQLARPNLICVDMGGTSFDVSLVIDGRPDISAQAEVEGFPVLMSAVNIHTIGAGGGSIAYVEAGGLRVGPRSAGAYPGPACYRRGGEQPTVTDANLLLGRIDVGAFLQGDMSLDREAAKEAVASVAGSLGLDEMTLAEGIVDVINAKMAQAIRRHHGRTRNGPELRDRGVRWSWADACRRPRGRTRVSRSDRPAIRGGTSAWGMLHSPLRQDYSQTFYRALDTLAADELLRTFEDLEAQAEQLSNVRA